MKKLILSAALIAGVSFFTACNNDDDGGNNNTNGGCLTCTMSAGGMTIEQDVCEGENGNAFVDGTDSGMAYDDYITGFTGGGGTCE